MKHKKKLFGLGIGMAAVIALGSVPAKQASAAAVGYINITKITYLYNGAVSILNQNGHWHKKLNRGILEVSLVLAVEM